MARKPRFNLPDIPQHIIQHGNNREPCFYVKGDYHRYLADLEDATALSSDPAKRHHAYRELFRSRI